MAYTKLCATVAALPAGQCGETLQPAAGEHLQKLCKLLLQVAGQETSEMAFYLVSQM